MTDETTSLIVEWMRRIDRRLDGVVDELRLQGKRIDALSAQLSGVGAQVSVLDERMARLEVRVDRIERRFDLVPGD